VKELPVKLEEQGNRMALWLEGVATAYLTRTQAISLAVRLLMWASGQGGKGDT